MLYIFLALLVYYEGTSADYKDECRNIQFGYIKKNTYS
jgi:hypothetical protein